MARFRDSPFEFLREVSLYVSGSGWRSYDHIVGQPVFYEGFSEEMKNAVMRSQMLKEKIRGLAGGRVDLEAGKGLFGGASGGVETVVSGHGDGYEKKRVKRRRELEESLTQVAEQMVDNMICKMESKMFIRGACYLATQLLTRAYHLGIHVSSVEVSCGSHPFNVYSASRSSIYSDSLCDYRSFDSVQWQNRLLSRSEPLYSYLTIDLM